MSTELPREQQRTIPPEVINAELSARLEFTERRLLSMATVAYELQAKCSELTALAANQGEEIDALRRELAEVQTNNTTSQSLAAREPNAGQRRRNGR